MTYQPPFFGRDSAQRMHQFSVAADLCTVLNQHWIVKRRTDYDSEAGNY